MKLQKKILAGLAVGAMLMTAGCSSSEAGDSGNTPPADLEKVVFMLDTNILPKHSIFFASVNKGFYEAEGLNVEILPGTGSLNTAIAVGSGAADFGFSDFGAMAGAVAHGSDVKQLLLVHAQSPFAVVTTAGSGIESWEDLKGKKVAGEPTGSTTVLFPIVEEMAGLKPGEVEVVPVDGTAKIPGMLAGQWDATLAYYVSDPPVLIGLGETPFSLKWADVGFELYSNGIITHNDTIDNNPKLVEKFVRATANGIKWACDNQDEAAKIMVEEVPEMNIAAASAGAKAACEILWIQESEENGLGYMTDAGVQNVLEITKKYLGLEANLEPKDLYTNDFNPGVMKNDKIALP